MDPAIAARIFSAVAVDPVKATPETRGSDVSAAPTAGPLATVAAHRVVPRLVHKLNGTMCDQGRLGRRLGQNCVSGCQRSRDLPRENRQREVPRADAGENPRGFGIGHVGCIVTQEIHRLAQFGHRIKQRLPGLTRQQGKQLAIMGFVKIGCGIEDAGAFGSWGIPGVGRGQCHFHIRRAGWGHRAGPVLRPCRIDHRLIRIGFGRVGQQGLRIPVMGAELIPCRINLIQGWCVMQVKTPGIRSFRLEQFRPGRQCGRRGPDRNKRIGGDHFRWHILVHNLVDEG